MVSFKALIKKVVSDPKKKVKKDADRSSTKDKSVPVQDTDVQNQTIGPVDPYTAAQNKDKRVDEDRNTTNEEQDVQEEFSDHEVEEDHDNHSDDEDADTFEVAFEFEGRKEEDQDFACLSPEQIVEAQAAEMKSVADLFSLPVHVAGLLLRHFQWKKERLIQRMLENQEQVFKEAGVTSDGAANSSISKAIQLHGEEMCSICAEDMPAEECTALGCSHRFCNGCWKDYLTSKIKEGEVTKLKCPHLKCNLIVDEASVKKLVPSDVYERYIRFITKAFVEDSDGRIKWCPQPHCGNAITADMISGTVAKCSCGYRFCFSCHREAHFPAVCEQVKQWEKKCKDDSETTHWKYANTKDCPKCETAVEKNGGCNHMTCRQCKHEWCWVCIRPWKGHNDYYNCNKFMKKEKPAKSGWFSLRSSKRDKAREKEEEREKNRVALERYLHYYTRFVNHSHSSELEKQIRIRANTKMSELQKQASTSSEVQYIFEGTEVLLECRNVLKWTYVVAYYLPETGPEKELFEYLQEDLEKTTESLSEILESNEAKPEDRLKALNIIQLSKTQKDNLLRGVEQGLTELTTK